MSKNDSLGDRMKFYEGISSNNRLMPRIPTLARLDGKAFHTFCKGLNRPFDARLSDLMQAVTEYLVQESHPIIGYTQSDEITLIWLNEEPDSMIYFDGRPEKMISVLAAMASVEFNRLLPEMLPEKAELRPVFDCRVWNVPNKAEAVNALVWREQDATRNSLSMAAQAVYSHRQLHGKKRSKMHDMLMEKGINWNDYPDRQKRGVYVRRETYEKEPGVIRTRIGQVELPPIVKITNRVEVIFDQEKPITQQELGDG